MAWYSAGETKTVETRDYPRPELREGVEFHRKFLRRQVLMALVDELEDGKEYVIKLIETKGGYEGAVRFEDQPVLITKLTFRRVTGDQYR